MAEQQVMESVNKLEHHLHKTAEALDRRIANNNDEIDRIMANLKIRLGDIRRQTNQKIDQINIKMTLINDKLDEMERGLIDSQGDDYQSDDNLNND